jgi:hypothetical protein
MWEMDIGRGCRLGKVKLAEVPSQAFSIGRLGFGRRQAGLLHGPFQILGLLLELGLLLLLGLHFLEKSSLTLVEELLTFLQRRATLLDGGLLAVQLFLELGQSGDFLGAAASALL